MIAETDTQTALREPLPERGEKGLLARSNAVVVKNAIELDGNKPNEKAQRMFETQAYKTNISTSPIQATRQQQKLMGATGINKQKSDIYMGPGRAGRLALLISRNMYRIQMHLQKVVLKICKVVPGVMLNIWPKRS
ncbi:MAG: hypothetical protein ACMZI0_03645 [Symbiopectobacterium sp.]|uniref:hypothetical protein n=1 Tax=Symbiopectobacterium sp. TaxID=2952789 RepID=UPI0039ED80B4